MPIIICIIGMDKEPKVRGDKSFSQMIMKRIYSVLPVIGVLISVVFSSCSKSEAVEDGVYKVNIQATWDSSESTRALREEIIAEWMNDYFLIDYFEVGDKVYVYKLTRDNYYYENILNYEEVGILTCTEGGSACTLEGSLTGSFADGDDLGFSYRHPLSAFNYTGQKGTLSDLAAKFDYAWGIVDDIVVDEENHTIDVPRYDRQGHPDQPVWFTFRSCQIVVRFVLMDENEQPLVPDKVVFNTSDGGFVRKATDLTPTELGSIEIVNPSSNIVYVALRGDADRSGIINTPSFVITANVGDDIYYYEKSSFVGEPSNMWNNYKRITVYMNKQ